MQWNYKKVPVDNSKILIKYYGAGGYSLALYKDNKFKINNNEVIFKKSFKKWSYISNI